MCTAVLPTLSPVTVKICVATEPAARGVTVTMFVSCTVTRSVIGQSGGATKIALPLAPTPTSVSVSGVST